MHVVFEGIDGSGKTTLSTLVARRLRASGRGVTHLREGGRYGSEVGQAVRELARDARLLAMDPRTELLLGAAREAQLGRELTIPARARGELIVGDRSAASLEVLGLARGLPREEVAAIAHAAQRGAEPDLTILVDVDPTLARARRKASKTLEAEDRAPGRKNLAGAGLQARMRRAYLELAAERGWVVLDNGGLRGIDDVAVRAEAAIVAFQHGGLAAARTAVGAPESRVAGTSQLEDTTAALMAWIDARAAGEPSVAAWMLGGLPGPEAAARREALVERCAPQVLTGLRGLWDDAALALRRRFVRAEPIAVARSLVVPKRLAASERPAVLDSLLAECAVGAPGDAARALRGRDDACAWALRDALAQRSSAAPSVAASLAGLASPRAWTARDRWLASLGGRDQLITHALAAAAAGSVAGLDDEPAWRIRRAAWTEAPVASLASLAGCASDDAWAWRDAYAVPAARVVLRSLGGLAGERAAKLRAELAPRCPEAVESTAGLDDDAAWRLREDAVAAWPSAVLDVLSVGPPSPRARTLARSITSQFAGDLGVLASAATFALRHPGGA